MSLSYIIGIFIFISGSYILGLLTWLFYLAITHLMKVKDDLHPVAKFNAYILIGIGFPLDVLVNLVSSVFLLDLPREFLFTSRLQRLKKRPTWKWQATVAWWMCEHLLNQFDDGHC